MRRHKLHTYRKRRGLLASVAHRFRERQIYLRAEGEVQFITLKPWVQIVGLTGLLAGLFWLAFSSINIVFKDQLLALRERGMYDARLEYEDRIAEMRNDVDLLNDRLMIDQNEYLERADQIKIEFDKLVDRHKRLVEFFRQDSARRSEGIAEPQTLEKLPMPPAEEMPADSHGDQSELENGVPKHDLNEMKFAERYKRAFTTEDDAAKPLEELKSLFEKYERMEIALLDEATSVAEQRADRARAIFKGLGLDDRKVVATSDYPSGGTGGPLIAIGQGDDSNDEVSRRLEKLVDAYEAYDKMRYEALQLPLYMPLNDVVRMTSGFGIRRDPFRHTIAMHAGVDFKSGMNSPVYATADGKVNAAGWEGAYGRMVEIIHDNGVATRYAHLSSIAVAVGDKVRRGDMVGRLGNTGRSTGPHLHYETRVKGRAVDPVRFWQTSNAVQELSKKE
ncbi:MAG: M23 family metallopeptidase [Aestuariivirgaceae bacterium]